MNIARQWKIISKSLKILTTGTEVSEDESYMAIDLKVSAEDCWIGAYDYSNDPSEIREGWGEWCDKEWEALVREHCESFKASD